MYKYIDLLSEFETSSSLTGICSAYKTHCCAVLSIGKLPTYLQLLLLPVIIAEVLSLLLLCNQVDFGGDEDKRVVT